MAEYLPSYIVGTGLAPVLVPLHAPVLVPLHVLSSWIGWVYVNIMGLPPFPRRSLVAVPSPLSTLIQINRTRIRTQSQRRLGGSPYISISCSASSISVHINWKTGIDRTSVGICIKVKAGISQ